MKKILLITFLIFYQFGAAQLIDPFGKVITHEIKLTKLDDGAYMGAMEWTTGGIDSLQRFVVKNLDVKAPVMVRIISKAPDHNIDLSFHKKTWKEIESKTSTNGDKFVDKIFRTMGMAGIGVSSKVAGIPYLIIVKVGLQFPSTKALIRVTDDIEEYNRHLSKLGIATIADTDKNVTSSKNYGIASTNSGNNDNTLMYIIIGLLALIIILLGVFLIRKQKSKTTLALWFAMCLSAYTMGQSNAPKSVPIGNPNGDAVFVEYRTSNVTNQNPVTSNAEMYRQDGSLVTFDTDGTMTTTHIPIGISQGTKELTGEEAVEVLRRIKEANEEFDRDYRENMSGEPTEGGQRIPPVDQTRDELNQLRRQVQQLQQEVDLLSQGDEEYDDNEMDFNEDQILIYCEELNSCRDCHHELMTSILKTDAYFRYLQDFYSNEIEDINNKIAHGNAYTQIHGALAIVWQRILHKNINPAVNNLKKAYSDKFDEYLESMIRNLEAMDTRCNPMNSTRGTLSSGLKEQSRQIIEHYRRAKIIN